MKAVAFLLASSLAAVSSMAIASAYQVSCSGPGPTSTTAAGKRDEASSGCEKRVPQFDGLRFIETLVTAHR